MVRQLFNAWKGRGIWRKLKRQYKIDYDSIVLILPERDEEWNAEALRFLPDYKERKRAAKALILTADPDAWEQIQDYSIPGLTKSTITSADLELLLQYYCFYKFYDNIVFLFLDKPVDNLSALILQQGCVSKRELICLGYYNLREVPVHV